MKHPNFLRRATPLLVLTAILMTLAVPATALLSGESADVASVAAFAKNGTVSDVITFSADDFFVETTGKAELDSILLNSLPDVNAGVLMLGNSALIPGDQISLSAVSGMKFYPLTAPTVASTSFTFTPIFSSGLAGDEVAVSLYLLSAANSAPIAENLDLCTYK
ncbi:MAG: S-layer homology domain-containing protein, partial [Clostridia bacterium]|nr:S-layer homology domain-containing protein [Clostridia bacterium]